jgi:hypothetical protein
LPHRGLNSEQTSCLGTQAGYIEVLMNISTSSFSSSLDVTWPPDKLGQSLFSGAWLQLLLLIFLMNLCS